MEIDSRFKIEFFPTSEEQIKKAYNAYIFKKRALWEYMINYVKRLSNNPTLKISLRKEIPVVEERTDFIKLMKRLGYDGPVIYRAARLIPSQKMASDLLKKILLVDEEEEDEGYIAGGAQKASEFTGSMISKELERDKKELLFKISLLQENYNDLREKYMKCEEIIKEKDSLISILKNSIDEYKGDIENYKSQNPDIPPPPPPYDIEDVFVPSIPPPLPPPPMDNIVEDVEKKLNQQSQKVGEMGKEIGKSFAELLKDQKTKLVKREDQVVTTKEEAKKDADGLMGILSRALAKRRGAIDEEEEEEEENEFVDSLFFCNWCGKKPTIACSCENNVYCSKKCQEFHWKNIHSIVCSTIDAHPIDSTDIYIVVRSKNPYTFQGNMDGSKMAFVVDKHDILPGETLLLKKNHTYHFIAGEKFTDHPFFISDVDPVGGKQTRPKKYISSYGETFEFTPTKQQSYYAICDNHPYMGFEIKVV